MSDKRLQTKHDVLRTIRYRRILYCPTERVCPTCRRHFESWLPTSSHTETCPGCRQREREGVRRGR